MKNLTSCGINNINNVCYDISKAYGKVYGENIENQLNYKCAELVYNKKKEINPRLTYIRHLPKPIEWNQNPHYYPELLNKLNDPDKALQTCYSKCLDSKNQNECKLNCKYDNDAVIKQDNTYKTPHNKETYTYKTLHNNKNKYGNSKNYSGSDHNYVYCIVGVVVVLIFIIIYYFLKSRNSNVV